MGFLKAGIKAFMNTPIGKKISESFFKWTKKSSDKKQKEKQVDLNDRKQNNKANTEKKEDKLT